MVTEASVWAIFLLPLASFLIIALVIRPFFNRYAGVSGILLIIALAGSLLLSLQALAAVIRGDAAELRAFQWLTLGDATIEFSLLLDPLTATMAVVVTSVSLMVQIYSLGYMKGDPGYARYFAYMSLFTASMLGLTLVSNIVALYAFWELVGVSSYLLIGFWHERPAAAAAAKKAFIITRIGDLGLLLAILYLYFQADQFRAAGLNPFHIPDIWQAVQPAATGAAILAGTGLTWLTLGIFAAAVGKSGQFPLHSWLPDAMEGPTPVSALIHAATMVAAGVFLVGRFYPVFLAAQDTLAVVALVGGFTALMAATLGLVMNDIKRVMAYSTVSQLGYMMAALGLGAFPAAIFHLVTHASFKALLFLGAGSVNHATGTFDMRYMGGLRRYMPLTYALVLIGGLSLVGIFPLSGFWSKDEILVSAWTGAGVVEPWVSRSVLLMLLLGVLLTAFYTLRMIYMTFHGEFRGGVERERADAGGDAHGDDAHGSVHLAESPMVMVAPMVVLAVGAVFLGFVSNPQWIDLAGIPKHWMTEFLEHGMAPVLSSAAPQLVMPKFSLVAAALATAIAAVGIVLATWHYVFRGGQDEEPLESLGPTQRVLTEKYYIDALYEDALTRGAFYRAFAGAVDWVDKNVVDRLADSVGSVFRNVGRLALAPLQTGEVQAYGLAVALGCLIILLGLALW